MPKSPSGKKRPADTVSNAVHVMRMLTGEIDREPDERNPAAVALGALGGKARAESLGKTRRSQIAKKAAKARWKGHK
jgi:hypothetical protein